MPDNRPSLANMIEARERIRAKAVDLLERRHAAGIEELSGPDATRFRAMVSDLSDLDEDIETRREDDRRGTVPERYANLGKLENRSVSSAGRLSPLGHTDEQLRRAFDQINRGETAVLETRAPADVTGLVPPELFPVPIFPRHEGRLLERLPGHAIDVPALEYIEVVSTTGTAAVVPPGQPKPELVMPADQKTATARKIAAHVGITWESYSGDFPAFVTAVQTELMRCITDAENQQLYGGAGEASGEVNGLLSSPNILTFTATGYGPNSEHWTDLLGAISTLRSGPALASPDLFLLHPHTWAALRAEQDQYGRFYVAADPSRDQVEQAWGIDVLQSVQFTPGVGVLLDTTIYGRVVVRESLVTRIGYAGTDFTQNVVRLLSEERITQTIERPQAICKITGLPTAAPTATETKSSGRK